MKNLLYLINGKKVVNKEVNSGIDTIDLLKRSNDENSVFEYLIFLEQTANGWIYDSNYKLHVYSAVDDIMFCNETTSDHLFLELDLLVQQEKSTEKSSAFIDQLMYDLVSGEIVVDSEIVLHTIATMFMKIFRDAVNSEDVVVQPTGPAKQLLVDGNQLLYHASDSLNPCELDIDDEVRTNFGLGIYFGTTVDDMIGEYGDDVKAVKIFNKSTVTVGTPDWDKVVKLAIHKDNLLHGYANVDFSEIITSKTISDAAIQLGYDVIVNNDSYPFGTEVVVLDTSVIKYDPDMYLY